MTEPYEGMWDFDGSWAPSEDNPYTGHRFQTFTLGVFQWAKRANGKGLKRGKVVERVKGVRGMPKPAYEKARAICAERNKAK